MYKMYLESLENIELEKKSHHKHSVNEINDKTERNNHNVFGKSFFVPIHNPDRRVHFPVLNKQRSGTEKGERGLKKSPTTVST